MYVDRKEGLRHSEPLAIELAEFWRSIEEDAVDRLLEHPDRPTRKYWEDRFRQAYANCNEQGVPESDLKTCTTRHFWSDLTRLAHEELQEVSNEAQRAYWTSVLAYAHTQILLNGKPRSASEKLS